jgi:hypothetical protein
LNPRDFVIFAFRGTVVRRLGEETKMAHGTAGGIASIATPSGRRTPLNRQQVVGFWAAWFGWMLDGMDSANRNHL